MFAGGVISIHGIILEIKYIPATDQSDCRIKLKYGINIVRVIGSRLLITKPLKHYPVHSYI